MAASTPPQDEWRQQWVHTQVELERLSRDLDSRQQRGGDISVMRSAQADAARLDQELTHLLREQFMKIFSTFHPALVGRLQPELTLFLDFLIFKYSVGEGRPLPGMYLMNLRFRDERAVATYASNSTASRSRVEELSGHSGVEGPGLSLTQRNLYCLGAVFLRYFWSRAGQAASRAHWGDAPAGSWKALTWRGILHAEAGYRYASFLNFLLFLKTGRYRSLLERLLSARAVYARPSAARGISYEYLNRQLVWAEVSEVLLFLLPLVNIAAVKRAVHKVLPRLPVFPFASAGASLGGDMPGSSALENCGICGAVDILMPYLAKPCEHVFCYYCLRGHTYRDPEYQCPTCSTRVEGLRPGFFRAEHK